MKKRQEEERLHNIQRKTRAWWKETKVKKRLIVLLFHVTWTLPYI